MREGRRETCGGGRGAGARRNFRLPGTTVRYPPDRLVDIQHTVLELTVVPEKRTLSGLATLTVEPVGSALRRLGLDLCELTVDSVEVDGRAAAFHHEAGRLEIELRSPAAVGKRLTVAVAYHGSPRTGLNFVGPDADYPDRPYQVWSQGQDEYARYWFPTHDFPNIKSTTEMFVTVPARYSTVANGALISVTRAGRNRVWHWKAAVPHVAYLVSLVVGEFESWSEDCDGVRLDFHVPPGRLQDARRVFADSADMVRLFADFTAQPYPYEKYAQVVVRDFTWGGMENTSATTLVDYIIPDERAMPDYGVYTAQTLIAHELAHQWFGDFVTCREWAHAWLNEGFASYFEILWLEHSLGTDEAQQALIEDADAYLVEDAEYRRPIVCRTYVEPHALFDRHLYEKGEWVLWMLRQVVGDALFKASVQAYVARHAAGLVVTEDLQRVFEDVTGRSLGWFFDQWVNGGGHPDFEVSYRWDTDSSTAMLAVKQTQTVDDVTHLFRAPVVIAFGQPGGREPVLREVEVGARATPEDGFTFNLPHRPTWVRFDRQNRVLKTLKFDRPDELLAAQLTEDEVTGRIEAAGALGRRGSAAAITALAAALRGDTFWGVRAAAAKALGETRATAARAALKAALKDPQARVRAAAASALGAFVGDEQAAASLVGVLSDRSYLAAGAATAALGRTRSAKALPALRKALKTPSHRELIRQGGIAGLEALHDPTLIPEVLAVAKPGGWSRLRQQALVRAATMALELPREARGAVRQAAQEALFDPLYFVRLGGIQALQQLGDPGAIPKLRALSERDVEGAVRQACREAIESLGAGRTDEDAVRHLREEIEDLRIDAAQLRDRVMAVEARPAPKKRGKGGGRK